MRYRRYRQRGGTYFFTVNLADRRSHLLVERVDLLRDCVRRVKRRHPFDILGWVVLPDHLHALWTLPEIDGDNAVRWALIKASFSRQVPRNEGRNASRAAKGERGLWQRRFWEHLVVDEDDLRRHLDYIHINPVKHGWAQRAAAWPYSSFHRYVRSGELPADWAAPGQDEVGGWGER